MAKQRSPLPKELRPRRDWQDDAACAIGDPRDTLLLFYSTRVEAVTQAKRICSVCPVRRDCLVDALRTGERFGTRGGYTSAERRGALKRRGGDIPALMQDDRDGVFHQPKRRKRAS